MASPNEVQDTVLVFTARSPERILREGGSQAWVLDPLRVRLTPWLVCCQNQHHKDPVFEDATEPHGSAFLIGKISGVWPSSEPGNQKRWLVAISAFARISVPDAWRGWRNPVRYTSLADLGIKPATLKFEPLPVVERRSPTSSAQPASTGGALTISEAKRGLALTFGVSEDAIEITIRA